MLEEGGFEVVAASHGSDALLALVIAPVDLCAAVIDIALGPGPDGWVVAEHVRATHPGLPVIFVTAGPMVGWQALSPPGSIILAKPFRRDDLLGLLWTLLASPIQSNTRH